MPSNRNLHFYKRHAEVYWANSNPFPITVARLIRYIKDKQRAGVQFNSTKSLLTGLKDHPSHGKTWRAKVLQNGKIVATFAAYKEMQLQEDILNPTMSKDERRARRIKAMTPHLLLPSPKEPLCAKSAKSLPMTMKRTGFIVKDKSTPPQSKVLHRYYTIQFHRLRSVAAVVIEPPCSIRFSFSMPIE